MTAGAGAPERAVLVKICGLTRPEDATAAVRAGADWLGLNFWPGSRRGIDLARGKEVAAAARAEAARLGARVVLAGVFVDQAEDWIAAVAAAVGLDRVQLHGDESPARCAALAARGLRVLKAVALGQAADVDRAAAYVAQAGLDLVLADTPSAGRGGSGRTFDWSLARALVARSGQQTGPAAGQVAGWRVILAGGLGPDNVAGAVARVAPYGVDVASGVESAPGIKDAAKMEAFVRRARGLDRSNP